MIIDVFFDHSVKNKLCTESTETAFSFFILSSYGKILQQRKTLQEQTVQSHRLLDY